MPIARHFTKRLRSDSSGVSTPTRTFSTRNGKHMGVDKISLPVTLLSTTNTLSYDAPDVTEARATWKFEDADSAMFPGFNGKTYRLQNDNSFDSKTSALSPDNSTRTSSEQNNIMSSHGSSSAPSTVPSSPASSKTPTLTDGSSVSSSPGLELNHLSCYFPDPGPAAVKRTPSARLSNKIPTAVPELNDSAPEIPQRARSHSKKEHVKLARQRSVRSAGQSRASSPTRGLDAATSPRSASDDANSTGPAGALAQLQESKFDFGLERNKHVPSPSSESSWDSSSDQTNQHPFGHELEKLDEVAEGFSGADQALLSPEDDYMIRFGLGKFGVDDYTDMIGAGPRFSVALSLNSNPESDSWSDWI